MDIVLKESERLNQTIKSFLAYARPQRFSLQQLDLRPIVQETAMLLRNSTEVERQHAGRGAAVATTPVMVDADEGQIRQIIWNLATNGLRAMPNGGTLCLSAVHEHDAGRTRRRCCWSRMKASAFRPRTSIRSSSRSAARSARAPGSGLAIVHRIVTDYGGQIEVRPRPAAARCSASRFPERCRGAGAERQAS